MGQNENENEEKQNGNDCCGLRWRMGQNENENEEKQNGNDCWRCGGEWDRMRTRMKKSRTGMIAGAFIPVLL